MHHRGAPGLLGAQLEGGIAIGQQLLHIFQLQWLKHLRVTEDRTDLGVGLHNRPHRPAKGGMALTAITPSQEPEGRHSRGFQVNNRKSSKQPVAGSNPAGGVNQKP